MKIICSLVALLMLFLCPALVGAEDLKLKVDWTFGYFSRYISNPVKGKTVYDGPAFQQSIKIMLEPLGLYFKPWFSYSPQGGLDSDSGDEIDYNFGIYRKLFGGKLAIDASYAYFNFHKFEESKGDLHVFALSLYPQEIITVKPYITLEGDVVHGKPLDTMKFFYRGGIRKDFELLDALASKRLFFDISFTGHSGWIGMKQSVVSSGKLSVSTKFKVWNEEIMPQINFQKGDGKFTEKNKIWWNLCISVPLLQ